MKLSIISLFAAAVMAASCGTTKTSTNTSAAYGLPVVIRSNFEASYPDASNVTYTTYDASDLSNMPIDWDLTDWTVLDANDYVVKFNMGKENMYAWYDSDGNWIGSAYLLSNSTLLPSAVSSTLNTTYNGYTIESIQKEMWKSKTAYEIKLSNSVDRIKVLVSEDGSILKQKAK